MGDWLDDLIDLSNDVKGIQKEITGLGDELTGKRKVVRTEVKAPWDPKAYADKPTIAYEQCTRHIAPSSSCEECAAVCPESAIDIEDGDVVIDPEACTGCGLCAAACPTDALALTRETPQWLVNRLDQQAAACEVCYVTCSQVKRTITPDSRVIVLPCLGILTAEVLYAVLVEHPNLAIYLPLDACEGCKWAIGEELYGEAIDTAEHWSGHAVGLECRARDLKLGPNRETERKRFVKDAARQMGGAALRANPLTRKATRVADFLRGDAKGKLAERLGAFVKDDSEDVSLTIATNRMVLLAAISAHRKQAAKVKVIVSKTDPEKCTCCRTCVDACPVGARRMADGEVLLDRRLCCDCGLCEELCPEQAIGRVRVNGRTLVGLSAQPEKVDVAKVAHDLVPSQVRHALGERDDGEEDEADDVGDDTDAPDEASEQASDS